MKWWLLAIPQYIVTGIFLGGGSYAAARVDEWFWGIGFETGLIGVLVLFAGVALLFTTRYPGGLFDLVVGLDRWVARVAAYVLLMRDEYPPFRLDQGGAEAEDSRSRPSRSRTRPYPSPASRLRRLRLLPAEAGPGDESRSWSSAPSRACSRSDSSSAAAGSSP